MKKGYSCGFFLFVGGLFRQVGMQNRVASSLSKISGCWGFGNMRPCSNKRPCLISAHPKIPEIK